MAKAIRTAVGVLVAVGGSLTAGPAQAQTETPAGPAAVHELRSQLGASINNAGLQQSLDWSWRRPLSTSGSLLLSEAHVAFGGTAAATPASLRGSAWVEIAPVSFFVVRAGIDPSQYFGTFDSLTSFESRLDAFDPDARRARGTAKPGRATKVYLTPTLQLRAGHFAGQSSLDLEHWSSTAPGPLFYEPTRDTLLDVSGDRLTTLTTVALYEHEQAGGGKLSVGPMHTLTRVHNSTFNQIQRVGAVAIEQMAGRHFGLNQPRAILQVGYYVDDSSKRGQLSAALAVGFTFHHR